MEQHPHLLYRAVTVQCDKPYALPAIGTLHWAVKL